MPLQIIEKIRIADNIRLKAPKNLITLGGINYPPPPPVGSGCDYICDAQPANPEPDSIAYIFGDDPTFGYRWWLQQLHTTRSHWTRLGFIVNKGKQTITENLIIGVVSASVASDPDLFMDVNNWEPLWAGEPYRFISLSSDILPSSATYYWIGIDVDYDYTAAEGLMLVMMTYEPDSIAGWRTGARTHGKCLPCWYGPLYGTEWAWTPTTGGLQIMGLVHTEPGGALTNGFGVPYNFSLPETAQNNEKWPWSFELWNAAAGYCGCPENLWFKMWQLDDKGNKVGDPLLKYEVDLACGYYVPVSGTIIFNEMGGWRFYGLIETGHKDGTTYVVDVATSFDVWVNCTEGIWGCDENGDKWVCTKGEWVKQTPSPHPDCVPKCSDYTSQSTCEANDCYWWNGSCHDSSPSCSEINNQTDCLAYDCYWYDGSCHSEQQQPEICDWIDAQGGPTGLDVADVFVIIDSYVYNTPPSGYTFIPTLKNVFGVIDYYLGFDGDEKTGCDYF